MSTESSARRQSGRLAVRAVRARAISAMRAPERERGATREHRDQPGPPAARGLVQNTFEMSSGAVGGGVALEIVVTHGCVWCGRECVPALPRTLSLCGRLDKPCA
jgi:hypothetical protein